MPNDNGWPEWSKYVLKSIEQLQVQGKEQYSDSTRRLRDIEARLVALEERVKAVSRTQGMIWGAVSAVAVSALIALLERIA